MNAAEYMYTVGCNLQTELIIWYMLGVHRIIGVGIRTFRSKKKTKRSADEYSSFQIQECGSTTLETTLDAFCERSFNLLDATNAAI